MDGFSLSLEQGEVAAVLGPSGQGKSTLLRLIAGLEIPAEGSIAVGGVTLVDERTFLPPEKRGVGMVFQDYSLFPHLTAARNITFGLHRMSPKERAVRLREMLELVRLTGCEARYPHELSGGQQQRVALARALAPGPRLLLLDEPFSSLDAELRASIRSELKAILAQAGMTCLVVTHDRADAESICSRVVTVG
ncbi:ABC transporter ATP-binding protein [Paenibacillus sp. CC-CFT747]|nr:ABC transporter ATP-binding protein [Paenibacillus sp. CC-CFT747]